MHTTVCTFPDRGAAELARDELLRSGFRDVHIEHRAAGADTGAHGGEDPRGWEGTDHEIAVDRDVVDRVAGFFVRLFGQDEPEAHHRRYADAVESGRYVLVVDAHDQTEAERARTLLQGHSPSEVNLVHRPQRGSLREILGGSDDRGFAGSYHDRASAFDDPPADSGVVPGTAARWETREGADAANDRQGDWLTDRQEAARERALAAGEMGEPRPTDSRDPDLDHVGLRYEDKDKDKPGPR